MRSTYVSVFVFVASFCSRLIIVASIVSMQYLRAIGRIKSKRSPLNTSGSKGGLMGVNISTYEVRWIQPTRRSVMLGAFPSLTHCRLAKGEDFRRLPLSASLVGVLRAYF